MLRVAIIDDGINHKILEKKPNIKGTYYRINKNSIMKEQRFFNMFRGLSHADICFKIYSENLLNSNFEVISINILNKSNEKGNLNNLISALRWCCDNRVNLINLSIGTTNYWDFKFLDKELLELEKKNIIIVAAHSNKCILTYPASHKSVIGVRCDATGILKSGSYIVFDNHIFNDEIICSRNLSSQFPKIKYPIDGFNSFVTPFIAAKVHRTIELGHKGKKDIIDYLKKDGCTEAMIPSVIQKVIIKDDNINIPIIAVNSVLDNIDDFLGLLIDAFEREGYVPFSITNFGMDRLNDISLNNLIQNYDSDILERIKFVQSYTRADLLFIVTNLELLEILYKAKLVDIYISSNNAMVNQYEYIEYDTYSKDSVDIVKDKITSLLS